MKKRPVPLTAFALLRRIILFAKPFQKALGIIFLCILSITAVEALNSYCFSRIFDIVQKHGTDRAYLLPALWLVAAAMGLLFVRIAIVAGQSSVRIKRLSMLIQNHLSHESIVKFFSFSHGQHINEHSGVKQSIVNSGATSIRTQMDALLYKLFPTVAQFTASLFVLFFAGWYIGSLFVFAGLVFCFMMYRMNNSLVPGVRKIRDRGQANARLISELFRFVTLVKSENQEDRSLDDLSTALQKHQDVFVATWMPTISYLTGVRSITAAIRYGALFLTVYLLFAGRITAGTMFLVFSYSSIFVTSLWDFMEMHQQFLIDRINIEKYLELLDVQTDIVVIENPIRPREFKGRIEFKNVSFWYPQRVRSYEELEDTAIQDDPVLKSLSFVIEAGEKVGIVGESGSGKSTIANLIRRGFDPQEGQILIDGNDLRLLDPGNFLRHVGSVEQDVVMLDRSIRDNILFGLHEGSLPVSDDRLSELSRIARIDAFFERLEHGYQTVVGEKGVKLSGGERQRVGIARALAKNPAILLLDEATSALDAVSERMVQDSIEEASAGRTAIIIAHRLSTVKNCDRILVFRKGVLVAEGSHSELLDTCEYYGELVQYQMVA